MIQKNSIIRKSLMIQKVFHLEVWTTIFLDFHNPKSYVDTSIIDGLVELRNVIG